MVPETLYIINKFLADICLKFRRQFIYGAGKHKVLPYDQPQLVTDIIEPVVRIITAAPYTDCVIIRRNTLPEKFPGRFRRHSSKKMILRDIVRSHGKDCHPVHLVSKTRSPLIFVRPHSQSPKTDPSFPDIGSLPFCI